MKVVNYTNGSYGTIFWPKISLYPDRSDLLYFNYQYIHENDGQVTSNIKKLFENCGIRFEKIKLDEIPDDVKFWLEHHEGIQ